VFVARKTNLQLPITAAHMAVAVAKTWQPANVSLLVIAAALVPTSGVADSYYRRRAVVKHLACAR